MLRSLRRCAPPRWLLVVAAVLFCLRSVSCIPVEDLGEYWVKGVIDPKLEGHWRKMGVKYRSQDQYVSFEKAGTHYHFRQTDADELHWPKGVKEPATQARSLVVGRHRFLMLRYIMPAAPASSQPAKQKEADVGQRMQCALLRYAIEGGKLVSYALDEKALADAIEKGRISGRVDKNDPVGSVISKLDDKTVRSLAALADGPENWRVMARYTRVKDLAKAVKESRTYPATRDTPANTLVNIDLPDLKYLADAKAHLLLRHLQASPEWRVFNDRGQIVCYRREWTSGRWEVSLNGFKSSFDSTASVDGFWQIRYLFRFAEKAGGPFAKFRYFTKVEPLAGKVHLQLKKSGQGIESYLAVGQGGLWFEFFEQAGTEPRTRTRRALKWLAGFLAGIRKAEAEIATSGYAAKLLPAGSIQKGKPSIQVRDGFQGGIYDVCAWVNPGAAGEVWLKVFDANTNKPLSEERIAAGSNERIGWAKDPSILFSYNSNITVYEGDWDHFYDARFELWFGDHKTSKQRKLVETTRKICGWQR